jgi:hypothetical protein
MHKDLKISQVFKFMSEAVDEIKDIVKSESAFLNEFEQINHMPEVNSIEIHTAYDPYSDGLDIGMTKIVTKADDLIPTHIKGIKSAISDFPDHSKIYIRHAPDVSSDGVRISIYTRLIIIA